MKLVLPKEAKAYLSAVLKKCVASPDVPRHTRRKIEYLATKFDGESAYVSLKESDRISLNKFLNTIEQDVLLNLMENKTLDDQRKEVIKKHMEVVDGIRKHLN